MNRTICITVAAALLTGCGAGAGVSPPAPAQGGAAAQGVQRTPLYSRALPGACTVAAGEFGCYVQRNGDVQPVADPNAATISGYTAADLRAAYGLGPAGSARATGPLIAIVDAYDDPNAESDLAIYRSRFGLPPCTTANGCFTKTSSQGAAARYNQRWAEEISLDLAMASAACPACRIALIEAVNGNPNVLAMAVDDAAGKNPAAISNSYGVPGAKGSDHLDEHYDHPGIAVVASTGDDGTVQFPASSAHVTAVGGTVLAHDASARGWHESVWPRSGAGCSASVPAPPWQSGGACATRAVPDISFVAALDPGIAVYDSSDGGWIVLGGTSAGSPFVAGLYAQAQDFRASAGGAASIYAHAAALNAVDRFNDSSTTGSPNGLGAF